MNAYANLEAIEAQLSGTVTHNLKRKSRQIILTNDSGIDNLVRTTLLYIPQSPLH